MDTKFVLLLLVTLVVGVVIGHTLPKSNSPMPQSHLTTNDSTVSDTMSSMTAGLQGKTGDDFDKAFITEMVAHHEGAVAMAQLALKNAKHSEIKKLAQDIITAQNSEIASMRNWLSSWYGTN